MGRILNCSFIIYRYFCVSFAPIAFLVFVFPEFSMKEGTHEVFVQRKWVFGEWIPHLSYQTCLNLSSRFTLEFASHEELQSKLRIRIRWSRLVCRFSSSPSYRSVHLSFLQPVTSGRLLSHNHPARLKPSAQSQASFLITRRVVQVFYIILEPNEGESCSKMSVWS